MVDQIINLLFLFFNYDKCPRFIGADIIYCKMGLSIMFILGTIYFMSKRGFMGRSISFMSFALIVIFTFLGYLPFWIVFVSGMLFVFWIYQSRRSD